MSESERTFSMRNLILGLLNNAIWVLVVVVIVVFSTATSKFLRLDTLRNVLLHASVLGVLVVGQTLVLITANFDLSQESTVAVTAYIGAWLILPATTPAYGSGFMVPVPVAIVIMLLLGLLIGWINGNLITRARMNNFIVTLAMLIALRGVVLLVHRGIVLNGTPAPFNWLGSGSIGPIPVAIIAVLLFFIVGYAVLHGTRFGQELYAVGTNPQAARVGGVNSDRRVRQVYLISGVFAAIAGLMLAGQVTSVTTNFAQNWDFDIIAAAVIGGVSLNGGHGTMLGAAGGVILLSVLAAGLNLVNISPFWLDTVRGLVILLAMLLEAQKVRFRVGAPARATA